MDIDGVGSFPTAGGCDDSEESDWPVATTRSKQFRELNEQAWEWREASHVVRTRFGTRLSAHYDDVIMTMLASQITSLTVVYSIVYSGVNQRKHRSSASLAFMRKIHRGPVNFPHKWPVTRKMFPFDDVIMDRLCRSPNSTTISQVMLSIGPNQ